MPAHVRQIEPRMALSRMFGFVNPDSYSPQEYATTVNPIIEAAIKDGPVRVLSCQLEPHNRGVRLSLVCERTFRVISKRGADANAVLHESGKPSQSNFNKFVSGLFSLAERLTDVTLIDTLGNSHTFQRGDIEETDSNLSESGQPLDLSPLTEKLSYRPFV